jgi:hypothetical protein
MSKHAIEWHKECLGNARESLLRYREEIKRKQEDADRLERECIFYDGQIIRAEEMGLTEFDREKFGIKRVAR